MPRTTQKIALAVSLSSCVTPQNEIATKPPIVDIPGSSVFVNETPVYSPSHKHKNASMNCAQVDYLLREMNWGGVDFGQDERSVHVTIPDSTRPLLEGQKIRVGDTLLLAHVRSYPFIKEARIWVSGIDALRVEFSYKFNTRVDEKELGKTGPSPRISEFLLNPYPKSYFGFFLIDFLGNRTNDAVLLESLQPGKLSVEKGPSPNSAILRYSAVVPCD
jgi:hypothetical protein